MNMKLTALTIKKIRETYGDAFYLLDSRQFTKNYKELKKVFSDIYQNFNIAYSYKTNYTPKLCQLVNELGGYAEVVSEMELELAMQVGVKPKHIIWNGPIKSREALERYLKMGIEVNIDSVDEVEDIFTIAEQNPTCNLRIGLRCNYDVGDGVLSRFGFDVENTEFAQVIEHIRQHVNLTLVSLQCHFAKRSLRYWPARAKGMLNIIEMYGLHPERIDIGGGMYGKMAESLKEQFTEEIPTYADYANAAATIFAEYYQNREEKPQLVVEPGSALVGDCMKFVGTIKTIKNVRGKYFASVMGSQKNISMTGVNPPIEIISMGNAGCKYSEIDFVGFTCIEGDVLYRNYNGQLAKDDVIVISNCGSYSLVMKPPFILPNFPVVDISGENVELIKDGECFNDIFHTFMF